MHSCRCKTLRSTPCARRASGDCIDLPRPVYADAPRASDIVVGMSRAERGIGSTYQSRRPSDLGGTEPGVRVGRSRGASDTDGREHASTRYWFLAGAVAQVRVGGGATLPPHAQRCVDGQQHVISES
jgi:hypothetical protein